MIECPYCQFPIDEDRAFLTEGEEPYWCFTCIGCGGHFDIPVEDK